MGRILQGSLLSTIETYECQYDWPVDCFAQYGDRGIVFTKKGSYRTACVEAFPTNPKTFIRGEGATVQEAETNAWNKFEEQRDCPSHEFERGKYRNGAGICKHCKLFASDIFEPTTKCIVCNTPSYYSFDKNDNWYCEIHKDQNPDKINYFELD